MTAQRARTDQKSDKVESRTGLMSVRSLLLTTIAVGTGAGLAAAGQPWLAVPAAVGVLGGLHAIVSR